MERNNNLPCKYMAEFYDGKSILLTGAAGFLGSVILEVLLRCFPGIDRIYLLLRKKKGVDPQKRTSFIFQKRVFSSLLHDNPDITKKVTVLSGDICLPNLGLSDDDLEKICEEVTVVFHCAATVSFSKSLKNTVLQNAVGTRNVISLCRKLKNLEVLVYTSTAYSFSNYFPRIEEYVYRLPFKAQTFMHELDNGTEESFENLYQMCKPEWPNYYTFSKALAENILQDYASDLPIAIIRPSIIFISSKSGYIEEGNGLVDLCVMVGKGYIRAINGDPKCNMDFIPLDIAANIHVVAAWSLATGRSSNPLVVNATAGHVWTISSKHLFDSFVEISANHTVPHAFQTASIKIIKNKVFYWFYALYEHYIPALLMEIVLRLKNNKTKVISHYIFFDNILKSYLHFFTKSYEFDAKGMEILQQQMDPTEKELVYLNFDGLTVATCLEKMMTGSTIFDWGKDKKSETERLKIIKQRTKYFTFAKRTVLFLFLWLMYTIVAKVIF